MVSSLESPATLLDANAQDGWFDIDSGLKEWMYESGRQLNNLRFNRMVYRLLSRGLKCKSSAILNDDRIERIEAIARFAWNNYPGQLADVELDEYVMKLAEASFQCEPSPYQGSGSVLHYATTVYPVGGHSRVIANWIENDNRAAVIFLRRQAQPLPVFLAESKARCFINTHTDLEGTVTAFESLVTECKPSYVVLHHHPDDCFPLIAKSRFPWLPFIFFAHADYVYSLGPRADLTVVGSEAQSRVDSQYRNASTRLIVPLLIRKPFIAPRPPCSSGLRVVMMTRQDKMLPLNDWNSFLLLDHIASLECVSQVHVIGCSSEFASQHYHAKHARKLFYHGELVDPDSVLKTCHVYVESVPTGTMLGTLEAIALGCFPVFNPARVTVYPQGMAINHFHGLEDTSRYSSVESMADFLPLVGHLLNEVATGRTNAIQFQNKIRDNNASFIRSLDQVYRLAGPRTRDSKGRIELLCNENMRWFAEISSRHDISELFARILPRDRAVFAAAVLWKFAILGHRSVIGEGRARHLRHLVRIAKDTLLPQYVKVAL